MIRQWLRDRRARKRQERRLRTASQQSGRTGLAPPPNLADGGGADERALRERAQRVRSLPIPPQGLIDWVGGGDAAVFDQVGMTVFVQLALYCGLHPSQRLLEPGCGCGRNARHLALYLDPERGRFDGFDIARDAIDWASKNITATYPNLRFEFADIANSNYNPEGKIKGAEFAFPYADESFDVVYLPSVFTHMLSDEFEHYVAEISRVLAPGGRLLSWHFLLDATSREGIQAGTASIAFLDYDEVSAVQRLDIPARAIAFDEAYVKRVFSEAGLAPQALIHGSWSGREPEGFADYQDRILALKGAR